MSTWQALAAAYRAYRDARRAQTAARPQGRPGVDLAARVGRSGLIVAGLGAITAAGLLFNVEVGLVVAGLACFALHWELS